MSEVTTKIVRHLTTGGGVLNLFHGLCVTVHLSLVNCRIYKHDKYNLYNKKSKSFLSVQNLTGIGGRNTYLPLHIS